MQEQTWTKDIFWLILKLLLHLPYIKCNEPFKTLLFLSSMMLPLDVKNMFSIMNHNFRIIDLLVL